MPTCTNKHHFLGVVFQKKPNCKLEDIAGLQIAKDALIQIVILPVRFPHLFTGIYSGMGIWSIVLHVMWVMHWGYVAKSL